MADYLPRGKKIDNLSYQTIKTIKTVKVSNYNRAAPWGQYAEYLNTSAV